ncbi:3-oxo-5-alpha-steroid 4-dehydrogenase-domain-containing protein [Blakeslea trispora]|nr:3-oxo-5-alpha-steroid 4-dehydrogenase-domain-containing protein [Blakeslea trispora]
MDFVFFICCCLLLLSLLSICAQQLSELRASVLAYGPTTSWAHVLYGLRVPKHYFGHFYCIGLLTAMVCLNRTLWFVSDRSFFISKRQCFTGLIMMTLHLARRVYESYLIEQPSKQATMHLSHYLIGIGFYGAMVLGTWLEGTTSDLSWPVKSEPMTGLDLIVMALFVYASVHQHRCHVILASLRQTREPVYRIPRGDWFESIVAPHYFADILIYLSLCLLYRFQNAIVCCGLIWTIVNLSIVATETEAWYRKYFDAQYLSTFPQGRWKIIPGCY